MQDSCARRAVPPSLMPPRVFPLPKPFLYVLKPLAIKPNKDSADPPRPLQSTTLELKMFQM